MSARGARARELVIVEPIERLPEPERKVIDPIAVAALVLQIPPAIIASMDLVGRMAKRKKAAALIEAAAALRVEEGVEASVLTAEGTPRPLAELSPDDLLALAQANAAQQLP